MFVGFGRWARVEQHAARRGRVCRARGVKDILGHHQSDDRSCGAVAAALADGFDPAAHRALAAREACGPSWRTHGSGVRAPRVECSAGKPASAAPERAARTPATGCQRYARRDGAEKKSSHPSVGSPKRAHRHDTESSRAT